MRIPEWMRLAESELAKGVHEVPGQQDNPRILEYFKATSYWATHDEVPWCSAFVNWCLSQAGISGTRSAAARSWMQWGEAIDEPRYGCVTVLARGKNPAQGHVGFYTDTRDDGHILLLGGNQADAVSIATFLPDKVLTYRWPPGA